MSNNPFGTLRRHRDFRRLWMSALVSDLGTWMQAVTVSVLVAKSSGSAGATAMVFSALFIPQGLMSPVGGLIADRFDRRHVAMVINTIQAALAILLALVVHAGVRAPLGLAAIVLVQGCANAAGMPAYSSMIPLLVPREELLGALSLSSMTWNAGRAIGPALAAATTAIWGPAASISGNAVSFVVMGLVLTTIHRPLHGGGEVNLRKFRSEIANGARLAFRTAGPRTMLISVCCMQFCMGLMFSTIPSYAAEVDDWARLPNMLFAIMGLGALCGATAIAPMTARAGRWRVLTFLVSTTALSLFVAAVAHSAPLAMLALFLFGLSSPVSFMVSGSVVQRDSPEQFRGRILSIYSAIVGLSFGGFSILLGYVADHWLSLRATIAWSGVLLVGMVVATHTLWPSWRRIVDGNDPPARWFAASAD